MLVPGHRVLIRLSSPAAQAKALTDCWDQGLVAVPLDHREPRWRWYADHAGVASVLSDSGDERTHPAAPLDAELGLVLYTSGSTSDPKGVLLSRSAIRHNAMAVAERHGFAGKVHGTCLPLTHCNAICGSLLGGHLVGRPTVLLPQAPAEFASEIGKQGVAVAFTVPRLLERLVATAQRLPDCLEYLVVAAAPLSSKLAEAFYAINGPRLVQGYGMTEAVNFSFTCDAMSEKEWVRQYVENHPPVGVPLPGVVWRLSQEGEVQLSGAGLMNGYWCNDAASQASVTEDGWLRSGDLGSVRDGMLVLRGRSKEVIKRGGATMYPVEVEEQWGVPGASAFAVKCLNGQDELGMWLSSSASQAVEKVQRFPRWYKPSAVATGIPPMTSTGKSRRVTMAQRAVCAVEPPDTYEALCGVAVAAYRAMLTACPDRPANQLANTVRERAIDVVGAESRTAPILATGPAVCEALELLVAMWPAINEGRQDGTGMFRLKPGLWRRLMCEWPMGQYAALVEAQLGSLGLLTATSKLLELGAGVGNTTELVADKVPGLVVTDQRKGENCDALDFDLEFPAWANGFDGVFATNALHCSREPHQALRRCLGALRPGGWVVLGEGAPYPAPGRRWCLDPLFCTMPGWYDVGGFKHRNEWVVMLEAAGCIEVGWGAYAAGSLDFGGVVYGRKPE